ncbi:similar to FRAGILE HISTIDINE TRIAD [Actinidia rufa]|uniref:Similar to FRAGILE HISTIDINE TRIAD n=1 Tax=Actinidia rufa TaxID=165716 RepID=A0A7J0FLL0_9ERIC|nr:similar to FRAGILE HISTIDINE TRIAD [Actinidia rufa]
MVKAVQLLALPLSISLSSFRGFVIPSSSTSLRPVAATNRSGFNHHLHITRVSSTYTQSKATQKVGSRLEDHHKASSLTFGNPRQTVPHVHIHILPRRGGDFEKNDEIYDAIDVKEKELKEKLDLDKERKDRSLEEMAEEASEYRRLLL